MTGDLDAAEKDYAISVELGHVPATSKLRALRKQKAKDLQAAATGGTIAMAMGDLDASVAVPVRKQGLTSACIVVLDRQFSLEATMLTNMLFA